MQHANYKKVDDLLAPIFSEIYDKAWYKYALGLSSNIIHMSFRPVDNSTKAPCVSVVFSAEKWIYCTFEAAPPKEK
jgi:hypothetical protein